MDPTNRSPSVMEVIQEGATPPLHFRGRTMQMTLGLGGLSGRSLLRSTLVCLEGKAF